MAATSIIITRFFKLSKLRYSLRLGLIITSFVVSVTGAHTA
jgi:hypothetical protein